MDETVEQLSRLYDEHLSNASRIQLATDRVTARLAKPTALIAIILIMLAWVTVNFFGRAAGWAIDTFPYPILEFVSTVAALLVALLILTTQRHEDKLAEKRARLTLQIAALSEKKIAKVIELLEEQRRDNPMLPKRTDEAASEMAEPADAGSDLAPASGTSH